MKQPLRPQRDLQLAYLELGTSQFEYLLAEDPSRIVLTEGLSQFINFAWPDEDTRTLRGAYPGYAALEARGDGFCAYRVLSR